MRLRYCAQLCGNVQGYLQLQSSVQHFDIAFAIKKFFFVVHFLNAFWHENEAFLKDCSQNEIIALLVVFHLPYSKYKGHTLMFLLVSLSKSKFFTRFALVSFVQHSCRTCVALCRSYLTHIALVSLVSHSCRSCLALVL